MESLAALGVASNIIQIVDFSFRMVSRGHELYRSAEGKAAEHVRLESAASNLSELLEDLQKSKTHKDLKDLTAADRQLVALQTRCEAAVITLRQFLRKAEISGDHRKTKSIYQALRTIYTEKDLTHIADELGDIRKDLDTVLLVSLRYVFMPLALACSKCPC